MDKYEKVIRSKIHDLEIELKVLSNVEDSDINKLNIEIAKQRLNCLEEVLKECE